LLQAALVAENATSSESLVTLANLPTFRSDPRGRCYAARNWLCYCAPNGRLWGTISWGNPSVEQVRELATVIDCALASGERSLCVLADVRRVDGIDASGLAALAAYAGTRAAALTRSLGRLAVLRPQGLTGMVAEGFFHMVSAPCPAAVFAHVPLALAWLGVPEAESVVASVEELYASVSGADRFVVQLRTALETLPDDSLEEVNAARVAGLLGLSARTFQRRLRAANLRFRRELLEARIRVAQRRMRGSEVKLTALALELGFASPQHFSNAFREVTGQSPRRWRASLGN
jgi:AraC-like DNA-binding protein